MKLKNYKILFFLIIMLSCNAKTSRTSHCLKNGCCHYHISCFNDCCNNECCNDCFKNICPNYDETTIKKAKIGASTGIVSTIITGLSYAISKSFRMCLKNCWNCKTCDCCHKSYKGWVTCCCSCKCWTYSCCCCALKVSIISTLVGCGCLGCYKYYKYKNDEIECDCCDSIEDCCEDFCCYFRNKRAGAELGDIQDDLDAAIAENEMGFGADLKPGEFPFNPLATGYNPNGTVDSYGQIIQGGNTAYI